MNPDGWVYIGIKNSEAIYVSNDCLAQLGERKVRWELGFARRFPVKTDLSGNVVWVEAESAEQAIAKYRARSAK